MTPLTAPPEVRLKAFDVSCKVPVELPMVVVVDAAVELMLRVVPLMVVVVPAVLLPILVLAVELPVLIPVEP